VLATDIDEEPNANLRFYLTGEGADKFFLDKSGGKIIKSVCNTVDFTFANLFIIKLLNVEKI
jgi:hypothetical protein